MRLPWLLALLLAVLLGTVLVKEGEKRHRQRDEVGRARDEAAEFRGAFFRTQAALADVDKDRAATAATLQALAAHVSERAARSLDEEKLMEELKKKLDAKEGDVSSGGGIVTVHLADEILFPSGEAELSKKGKEVLARVGDVLRPLANKQILVGGHTDDAPIHTKQFPSNWELSTARAVNVVHFLLDTAGVDARKLTAAGYSQYHPRSADRAQNRRIELLLIPETPSETMPKAPTPSAPAPAETKPAAAKPTEAKPAPARPPVTGRAK